jgi:hypothetical protein
MNFGPNPSTLEGFGLWSIGLFRQNLEYLGSFDSGTLEFLRMVDSFGRSLLKTFDLCRCAGGEGGEGDRGRIDVWNSSIFRVRHFSGLLDFETFDVKSTHFKLLCFEFCIAQATMVKKRHSL